MHFVGTRYNVNAMILDHSDVTIESLEQIADGCVEFAKLSRCFGQVA